MGRRSHSQALDLWMNGTFVGHWVRAPQGERLQYDPLWVSSTSGRPLSRSLPFRPGNPVHTGAAVEAYFENLLPDSRSIRERIARRYQAPSLQAFDLLTQIGRDCVGALQLFPAGAEPAAPGPIESTPLSEAEVAQLLRAAVAPAGPWGTDDDEDDFRISIAGAQEKTALLHHQGQWCRPHGATPTTHILKLPMGLVGNMRADMHTSVENEWLCALIVQAYGLPIARCQPLQFEDMKALAVERFDRRWWGSDADRLLRLPQEDMCQASATPPTRKYESDGGPGMDRILALLDGSAQRDIDKSTFFQAQVLFWMLCATDGHAKNFSIFLRPQDSYALTPLYDVLSAYPLLGEGPGRLSPHEARMAMAARAGNAHYKMREILRRHWEDIGSRHGIVTPDGRPVSAVLDALIERTPSVIAAVREQLPGDFPEQLADSILDGLQGAAHRLAS